MIECPFCHKKFSEKEAKMRSLPQNKAYWKLCVETLSNELGYHRLEIHEILKALFLSETKYLKTKEGVKEVRIPRSTVSLSTSEFNEYMENIRTWASAELGIWLSAPLEGDYSDLQP